MTGIQAAGSAPIAQAIKTNSDKIIPVEKPETIATAIRIGAPVSWKKAVNAIRESHGTAETVTDEEILAGPENACSRLKAFSWSLQAPHPLQD